MLHGSTKPTIKPTRCGGRVTGYVVEFPGTDACGEFHGGTDAENESNARVFAEAFGRNYQMWREIDESLG